MFLLSNNLERRNKCRTTSYLFEYNAVGNVKTCCIIGAAYVNSIFEMIPKWD